MKNTLELLDEKDQLKKRAQEIVSGAEKEIRKLNDVENTEFDSITKQLAEIDNQIRSIEEDNKRNLNKVTKQTKTMENFSLLKAINDVANNRQLDERAQEVINAGIAEFRKSGQNYAGQIVLPVEQRATVSATVATAGEEIVAEDKLGILEPLRANLVMVQAGASYLSGLTGNVSIPAYSGSNVA
jgi:HK97 family phage major capsid protein